MKVAFVNERRLCESRFPFTTDPFSDGDVSETFSTEREEALKVEDGYVYIRECVMLTVKEEERGRIEIDWRLSVPEVREKREGRRDDSVMRNRRRSKETVQDVMVNTDVDVSESLRLQSCLSITVLVSEGRIFTEVYREVNSVD